MYSFLFSFHFFFLCALKPDILPMNNMCITASYKLDVGGVSLIEFIFPPRSQPRTHILVEELLGFYDY